MERKLYQELASTIDARTRCGNRENTEWFDRHTDRIQELLDMLPHGSGLDGEWSIDYDLSHLNKLVINMSYHAMNDAGYYDGWIDFTLIVLPSLTNEINLHIRGKFGKYSDIKDYLYEITNYALTQVVNV